MRSVALLVVILLAPSMTQAASGPRWTPTELAGFADVVVTGRVATIATGWDHEVRAIYTYVTVDLTEVLKGHIDADRITVKQLGGAVNGVVLNVTDQATFSVGEQVLLYLEARPRDGTLYTTALWQGKWDVRFGSRGQSIAVRTSPAAHAPADVREVLLSDVRAATAAGGASLAGRVTAYVADAPLPRVSAGFNLLGPFRYLYAPAVDVQAGGQPGLPGGGFSQVQAAIARWNRAGSAFRYVAGATDIAPRCSAQLTGNGRVTITFMDPCGELSNSGGTLALGGSYFVPGEGGTSSGQPFDRAVEGFIVNNDSALALSYLTNPGCFEEIQTHELGHVLGLDHSADPNALMYATINRDGCLNGTRGLRQDDIDGLFFIYGRDAVAQPPANAPTDVRVVTDLSQLRVTWRDAVLDSNSAATSYRVDFRAGHSDDGPVVVSLTQPGTSVELAIPPGVAGPYSVVVSGLNAAGAGPPSPRYDFVLGFPGATCSAAPAAVVEIRSSISNGFARVEWSAVPGATRYLIQAGASPGTSDLFPLTDLGGSTGAGAPVAPGFSGWVRVFAANQCGVSAPTDVLVQ
jgi:hypothetical protein